MGSGAIGIEFAYFYNAMGTEVIIVEYLDNIVPVEDNEISKQLERSFKKSLRAKKILHKQCSIKHKCWRVE